MTKGRGEVAIITGGASGIGRALGEALARRGAEVILADRQLAVAQEVAAQIVAGGGRALAAALDVRDEAAFRALVEETHARSGRIDMLFNNAGIGVGGPMEHYGIEDWDDVFDVNIRGVAYGVQAVYPVMRAQGFGHIVNTASMAGLLPAAMAGSYVASKHAVVGLSKSLRIEARPHGVRVSVLCPGVIRTPILTGGAYGRHAGPRPAAATVLRIFERLRPMDPADFAAQVLAAVARNEPVIVVPRWWKALWALERLSPRLSMVLWERLYERSRAEIDAALADVEVAGPAEREIHA